MVGCVKKKLKERLASQLLCVLEYLQKFLEVVSFIHLSVPSLEYGQRKILS